MDEYNTEVNKKNLKVWFNKDAKSDEVAQELAEEKYGPMVKHKPDSKWKPRFRAKLPFRNGKPMFSVVDQHGKEVSWFTETGETKKMIKDKEITVKTYEYDWSKWSARGMQVQMVIECEGYWVTSKNSYCTWKVVKLRFVLPDDVNSNVDFRDASEHTGAKGFDNLKQNVADIEEMLDDARVSDEDDE